MLRFALILTRSMTAVLCGCVVIHSSPETVSANSWNFRIEGALASISVSDLAAIVKVLQPTKFRDLRIIDRNRVEADISHEWMIV